MTDNPFPDDPNAEVCVHTGGPANAVVGRYGRNRVTGWYGSTVIDGDTMLVVDQDFPEGPVCDEILKLALADGRVFDPAGLVHGDVKLNDVPEDVVSGMIRLGFELALRCLDHDDGGPVSVGLPFMRHAEDDPLGQILMDGPSGHGRMRMKGIDLEGIGVAVAMVHKARGRAFGPSEQDAAVELLLDRIKEENAFVDSLSSPDSARA